MKKFRSLYYNNYLAKFILIWFNFLFSGIFPDFTSKNGKTILCSIFILEEKYIDYFKIDMEAFHY